MRDQQQPPRAGVARAAPATRRDTGCRPTRDCASLPAKLGASASGVCVQRTPGCAQRRDQLRVVQRAAGRRAVEFGRDERVRARRACCARVHARRSQSNSMSSPSAKRRQLGGDRFRHVLDRRELQRVRARAEDLRRDRQAAAGPAARPARSARRSRRRLRRTRGATRVRASSRQHVVQVQSADRRSRLRRLSTCDPKARDRERALPAARCTTSVGARPSHRRRSFSCMRRVRVEHDAHRLAAGHQPRGQLRVVRCMRSAAPITTASNSARKRCMWRRSSGPVTKRDAPVTVASRPSRLCPRCATTSASQPGPGAQRDEQIEQHARSDHPPPAAAPSTPRIPVARRSRFARGVHAQLTVLVERDRAVEHGPAACGAQRQRLQQPPRVVLPQHP